MRGSRTKLDYFKFRTLSPVLPAFEAVRAQFGNLADMLVLEPERPGKGNWKFMRRLLMVDVPLGWVEFGGDMQRGWSHWTFTGTACEWIEDHSGWLQWRQLAALEAANIRRLDIALTTLHCEVSHASVKAAYAAGEFCSGGRPPSFDPREPLPRERGWTVYVGTRKGQFKFFRGYEKAREALGAAFDAGMSPETWEYRGTHYPLDAVYRCEVEFKSTDDKFVPWEMIDEPDRYFAGAYPFLARLLPMVEPLVVSATLQDDARRSLEVALAHCRRAFGNTLFTALIAHEGDVQAVWRKIVGTKESQSLLEAGVLMTKH